jgi:hypothetical protein
MRALRGLVLAFGVFAASFALHVVAGAADLGWLFAIAVGLIFASAAGFPALAALLAGRADRFVIVAGGVAGYGLTLGALWAANGRAFAWWVWPLAAALVVAVSGAAFALAARIRRDGARASAAREAALAGEGPRAH